MKLRTVLISVVVSAALVGGAGYGAYYASQSQKAPIEVVPVSNVSMGGYYYDEQQTIYGSVTSQVAQTVQLNEEYGIDKIYVEVGDQVREGTPLFSYDMTLQELELEMQQLDLQTNELTLARLEKELDKLKKTPATASLERDPFTLTASAEESADVQEKTGALPETNASPEPEAGGETGTSPETGASGGADAQTEAGVSAETEPDDSDEPDAVVPDETEEDASAAPGGTDEGQHPETQDGVEVDEVEKVGGSSEGESRSTIEDSVLSFEALVLEIQATFLTYGEDLKAADIGEALGQAVAYYRKNLAEEKRTEEQQEDGSVKEIRTFELKDAVKAVLDRDETETLRKRCKTLDEYQVKYVEMLIAEAEELDEAGLPEAVAQIEEAYELLATKERESLEALEAPEHMEALKALAQEIQEQQGGQEPDEEADGESPEGGTGETVEGDPAESETSGGGTPEEVPDGVRQNTVTFDVSEGAAATVNGQDVTNSFAMAENGRIIFSLSPESGYQITEVLVDGSIPARKNEESDDPEDYIIEGIQTNDTIVSVRTQQDPEAETADDGMDEGAPATIEEAGGAGTSGDGGTGSGEGTPGDGGANSGEGTPGDGGMGSGEGTPGDGGTGSGEGTPGDGGTGSGEGTPGDGGTGSGEGTPDSGATAGIGADNGNTGTTAEFTVTINPGNLTEKHEVGRLVPLQADLGDVTLVFMGWSVAPTSADESRKVELSAEDVAGGYASFTMPEFDVTATAKYENAPDEIESYAATFLSNAELLLAENARQTYMDQGKDFLTELESAVVFYQQWLSDLATEIVDESELTTPKLDQYLLKANVSSYLTECDKAFQVTQLQERYRDLCLLYVKSLFEAIDPAAIDRDLLEKALDTYDQLGESWRKMLEKQWKKEQADLAEQSGEPWKENKKGKRIAPEGFLGIGETLEAYAVIQMFQEFLNLPPETPEEERYDMILDIWSRYQNLSDSQKLAVSSAPYFVETFKQYGLWQEEPETEFPDYYGGDDFGDDYGWGDEPMYTASELAEMIEDKEQEIKSCSLDIRQSELDLKQKQRIVDGKVVKSTMDGTVVSIGDADGSSDEDYFVKVANEAGLFAKGTMSELTLEKLKVGDTISGMLTTNGTSFTAVIKEISEYPESSSSFFYGMENSNASYYPFYALIEDTEGLEEGDAEIYLSGSAPNMDNSIYLENYFIRTETDGRTYVYKKGEDGKLTKQYVKTGKNTGWSLEIKEGLTFEDAIAFPYGKNVEEGAKTKDVDQLQDALM